MAEDDDDLNDFKLPPHSNETADAQLDKKALGMVKEYVASLNRSKNENTIRGDIRDNIVKLGINSLSFQHELTAQKMMDASDRRDYMAGRRRMARVFAMEDGLFAAEQEAVKKRKDRKKEREAKAAAAASGESPTDQERRLAADSNPRSNPKSGGAGGAKGRTKAKDAPEKPARKSAAQIAADRAEDAAEQAGRLREAQDAAPGATPGQVMSAGAAKSDAALAESIAAQEQIDGGQTLDSAIDSMKSQSQLSKEALEKAGLA